MLVAITGLLESGQTGERTNMVSSRGLKLQSASRSLLKSRTTLEKTTFSSEVI